MTPEELVADVCPTIGSLGSAFYFTPETLARGKELGLDGFRFYFLGRGGVLGDVEPQVVQSAFGYFEAGLISKMWTTGRETAGVSPREVGRAYVEVSRDFGRQRFSGLERLAGFCTAAEAVVAGVDPSALALYAALAAEPLPDDEPARAMQLVTVLRELRGSVHLVAVVSEGLSPKVAHYFRRPGDFATFGYSDQDIPTVGDAEREAISRVDARTDELMATAFSILDQKGREDLSAGVHEMAAAAS